MQYVAKDQLILGLVPGPFGFPQIRQCLGHVSIKLIAPTSPERL